MDNLRAYCFRNRFFHLVKTFQKCVSCILKFC